MSGRKKVILVAVIAVAALVLIIVIPCLVRASRNEALARKLHAEFDAWLASLPQVPDSENGALVILQGLNSLEPTPDAYDFHKEGEFIRGSQLEKTMLAYMKRNKKALETIEKGLDFTKWVYPVKYEEHFNAKLEHLMRIKNAQEAIEACGELAELEGDAVAAWREYVKILRLGSTLSQEPLMISQLVKAAVYHNAFRKLMSILSTQKLSRDMLQRSLELFRKIHARQMEWSVILEGEYRIFSKAIADGINGDESVRDELGMRGLVSWRSPDWQAEVEAFRKFLEFSRDVEAARFYEAPREYKDTALLKAAFLKEMLSFPAVKAAIMIPAIARSVERLAIAETYWRALIVMTAIRLFEAKNGRLPAKLDELGELVPEEMLTDPFSGKQLVYKLRNGDFCLYSVGIDGVDGKCEDTRELFQTRADKGEPDDIIFHAPRPR